MLLRSRLYLPYHPQPHLLMIEDSDEDFVAVVCATDDEVLDYLYWHVAFAGTAPVPAPRLILLALNLPGTDRRTLLAKKSNIQLKTLPIIVLTTSDIP